MCLHPDPIRRAFLLVYRRRSDCLTRSQRFARQRRASIGANALREIAVFTGDHAMTIARRQFLQLAGAGLLALAPQAFATEDYPTRPVRWIIGFPPGGGADQVARVDVAS